MFTLKNITKYFDEKLILKEVNFHLSNSKVTALVGPNGSGKSTLLKIISEEIDFDSGTIEKSKDVKISYFPQEIPVIDKVQTGRSYLFKKNPNLSNHNFFILLPILDKIKFPKEKLDLKINQLSEGEQGKLSLISIFSSNANLFLLDEPTNNLDFVGLTLLDKFISSSSANFFIISHDRKLLDRFSTSVVELSSEDHSLKIFTNIKYFDYLDKKNKEKEIKEKEYNNYIAEISRLEKTIKTKKEEAKKQQKGAKILRDNDKYVANFKKDRSKKIAGQALSIEKRLEKIEQIEKPGFRLPFNLSFGSTERSGDKVFTISQVVYKKDKLILGPINQTITYGERVVIVGPNGSGKSTLLKLLTKEINPISGTIGVGSRVRIGYLPQIIKTEQDQSLFHYFIKNTDIDQNNSRKILARFGFPKSKTNASINKISPGERSRLILASLMAKEINCLILDEPTNHLDVEALDRLEKAINEFSGTIIIVSHDRYLIEKIGATKTYLLENGQLNTINDYHEYENKIINN